MDRSCSQVLEHSNIDQTFPTVMEITVGEETDFN